MALWWGWFTELPEEGSVVIEGDSEPAALAAASTILLPAGCLEADEEPPELSVRPLLVADVEELMERTENLSVGLAAAESRGAAAAREAIAAGLEAEPRLGLLIVRHEVRKLAARVRAGELG